MTLARIRGYENCRKARWLAISLVLIILASSIEISADSKGRDSMILADIENKATLAITQNRIAMVKPIFSATAYTNAFYTFYYKYASAPEGEYVTTDLNLLNRTVVDDWKWSENIDYWFKSDLASSLHLILGETVTLIDQIDVDGGGLFQDGVRLYDVVILGFTEYVTAREYLYYKQFVASGGTLILMDACNFLAEVTYSNGYLSLTKGHGWEFNGTHARKSVYHRWYEENKNWIGSNYWLYWRGDHYDKIIVNGTNIFSNFIRTTLSECIRTSYGGHEENILQNMTDTDIIGYWNLINHCECSGYPVAAYMHKYRGGTVFHAGIMSSDVICSDWFIRVFLAVSIRFGLTGSIGQWVFPEPLVASDDFVESRIVLYGSYGVTTPSALWGRIHCDISLDETKEVLRCCHRCNLQNVTGKMTRQADADNHVRSNLILESQKVNDTYWRIDINTFYISNGNYSLEINATWYGVRYSSIVNELIGTLFLYIQNSWMMSILPWAIPLGAIICTALIIGIYSKFTKSRVL
jgi:hypothetical protein